MTKHLAAAAPQGNGSDPAESFWRGRADADRRERRFWALVHIATILVASGAVVWAILNLGTAVHRVADVIALK